MILRFKAQVVTVGSEGGLGTRPMSELVKIFRGAGIHLGYIRDTDEPIKHEAISSQRIFKGDPNPPVQYFHSAAKLANGRELWLAATPKQVFDSKPGTAPALV